VIRFENLTKSFWVDGERRVVIDKLTMELPRGKSIALLGRNGAGKSTLFKAILGLIDVNNGTVEINGRSIKEVRKNVVYVPQKSDVDWQFPATVFDIILMGRYPHKKMFQRMNKTDHDFARAQLFVWHAFAVGVWGFYGHQVRHLFGGRSDGGWGSAVPP